MRRMRTRNRNPAPLRSSSTACWIGGGLADLARPRPADDLPHFQRGRTMKTITLSSYIMDGLEAAALAPTGRHASHMAA